MLVYFVLKIINPDGSVAVEGQSEPGETWELALIRLHSQTVKDKDRRLLDRSHFGVFGDLAARGTGRGVAVVVRLAGAHLGTTHQKEYIRFETDPPQF